MNTPGTQPRSASRGGRSQSLFYRDLSASPVTRAPASRRELGTPGQAAAAAALWRENVGGVDPPPPPMFTLDDRIERSMEPPDQSYRNPESATRTPLSNVQGGGFNSYNYPDPIMLSSASPPTPPQNQSAASPIWWSASRDRSDGIVGREKDGGSPVSGVVQPQQTQPGGLLALEPPRDVVRPEVQRSGVATDAVEGDEWVTVFGFGAEETNTVMREFEKCGPIVDHVSGPGGANWVHIQYQNRYDAKKALLKDGILLNGSLIVGVKTLDPVQRQVLTDKREHPASMVLAPRATGWGAANASGQASQRPYYVQRNSESGPRATGVLATPAKSTVSKIVEFVFVDICQQPVSQGSSRPSFGLYESWRAPQATPNPRVWSANHFWSDLHGVDFGTTNNCNGGNPAFFQSQACGNGNRTLARMAVVRIDSISWIVKIATEGGEEPVGPTDVCGGLHNQ